VIEALRQQLAKDADQEQPEFCGGDRRVLLCFTCDPYQPHENGVTRQALKLLREYNVPFSVLTKGGMRAARDFDLYANGAGCFGTTLCFSSEASRREWEPGAAPLYGRLSALNNARGRGLATWLSVEPVIDPVQALDVLVIAAGIAHDIRVGKLNHHKLARQIDWRSFACRALELLQDQPSD